MGLNNWGFGKEGWSGVGTNPCQHYGRTRCRLLARARLQLQRGNVFPLETFHLRTQERLRGEPIRVYMSLW